MLDELRRYVQDRLEGLSSQSADDVAAGLAARAQGVAEQFSAFAAGFLQWSAEARKSLLAEVRDLVRRQIEEVGLATKQDVEGLRARLDRVEARLPAPAGRTPGSAGSKSPSRSKSSARGASSSRGSSGGRSGTSRGAGRSPRSTRAPGSG